MNGQAHMRRRDRTHWLAAVLVIGHAIAAGWAAAVQAAAAAAVSAHPPIEVKVVVVTMFEIGADSGDQPGEFQLWYERQKLDTRLPFAHHHDLFLNPDTGVLGIVTGVGTANSASAIMELGLDPRFDLTHAYWIVTGIAGVDPEDASIGSAAWSRYVVDGDLAYEIDAREMPRDWSTGIFALDSDRPYDPDAKPEEGQVFELNRPLVDWAFNLTRNVPLEDSAAMQKIRARYKGYPNARRPPFVLEGDNLAAMRFWQGRRMNDWANRWVRFWTHGRGNMVMSEQEDSGTLLSLGYLGRTGRVDNRRVLVLRTGSDFTIPPPGVSAARSLAIENKNGYAGLGPAVEAAYRVGARVVEEILANWPRYRERLPTAAQ